MQSLFYSESICRLDSKEVHETFRHVDPIHSFFFKAAAGTAQYPSSRLAFLSLALLIVFAQGGRGNCAKMVKKASQSDAAEAAVPVAMSKVEQATAKAARLQLAADSEHPQAMTGVLPSSLTDFLVTVTSLSPEPPSTAFVLYRDLYVAVFNVSCTRSPAWLAHTTKSSYYALPVTVCAACSVMQRLESRRTKSAGSSKPSPAARVAPAAVAVSPAPVVAASPPERRAEDAIRNSAVLPQPSLLPAGSGTAAPRCLSPEQIKQRLLKVYTLFDGVVDDEAILDALKMVQPTEEAITAVIKNMTVWRQAGIPADGAAADDLPVVDSEIGDAESLLLIPKTLHKAARVMLARLLPLPVL